MSEYNIWSPWFSFGEVFEYRGLIDETGETVRGIEVEWKGSTGLLHRDNGFRLRSLDYATGSFSNMDLYQSLVDVPCPLNKGNIGVYWLRIDTPLGHYDYIGLSGSEKTSIFKRLVDHFTKIAGTFGPSTGFGDTKNFKTFREEMENLGIDTDSPDFFENNVKICFVKVEDTTKAPKIKGMALEKFKKKYSDIPREEMDKLGIDTDSSGFCENNVKICFVEVKEGSEVNKKVAKIEGMAIQAFKDKYKIFPKLNARDETIGLERMPLE